MIKELNIMDLYDNLINNKKININLRYIYVFFSRKKYTVNMAYFLCPDNF